MVITSVSPLLIVLCPRTGPKRHRIKQGLFYFSLISYHWSEIGNTKTGLVIFSRSHRPTVADKKYSQTGGSRFAKKYSLTPISAMQLRSGSIITSLTPDGISKLTFKRS